MVDFVFVEQKLDPFAHGLCHVAAAPDDGGKIGSSFAGINAVFGSMFEVLENGGALQQGFGGNAAPVEADASQFGAFDHGCFKAQLGGADGGNVTARSASYDDDIVVHDVHF